MALLKLINSDGLLVLLIIIDTIQSSVCHQLYIKTDSRCFESIHSLPFIK